MGLQDFLSSDYGSASSSNLSSPWGSGVGGGTSAGVRGAPSCNPTGSVVPRPAVLLGRATSFRDIGSDKLCSNLKEVMLEFQLNGCDSPYNPEEEQLGRSGPGPMSGMGPAAGYLRQKSWPEPDRSPAVPLPSVSPRSDCWAEASTSSQWNSQLSITAPASPPLSDVITTEQMRILQELPDVVLHRLLRDLQTERDSQLGKRSNGNRLPEECRFCKNNNERESYYRSHLLKDALGRVSCPILRAFVCKRCGASGDTAHTIKYCPLTTYDERIHSENMMRSWRLQSRRRRVRLTSPPVYSQVNEFPYMLGAPSSGERYVEQPLDPLWAALEQKLML